MKPSGTEITQLFQAYLKETGRLWRVVDALGEEEVVTAT